MTGFSPTGSRALKGDHPGCVNPPLDSNEECWFQNSSEKGCPLDGTVLDADFLNGILGFLQLIGKKGDSDGDLPSVSACEDPSVYVECLKELTRTALCESETADATKIEDIQSNPGDYAAVVWDSNGSACTLTVSDLVNQTNGLIFLKGALPNQFWTAGGPTGDDMDYQVQADDWSVTANKDLWVKFGNSFWQLLPSGSSMSIQNSGGPSDFSQLVPLPAVDSTCVLGADLTFNKDNITIYCAP